MYKPVKFKSENSDSPYGAERKAPAGDIIWSAAEIRQNAF
jgi:hypothetical protein